MKWDITGDSNTYSARPRNQPPVDCPAAGDQPHELQHRSDQMDNDPSENGQNQFNTAIL